MTEDVLIGDRARALVVLDELKAIGVSSRWIVRDRLLLARIPRQLPIDTIKIDPSFIAKLNHDPSNHEIVTAIIGLAHALGMSVVSAGVENARQHQEVHQMGSDRAQGFYFARPMLASLIER